MILRLDKRRAGEFVILDKGFINDAGISYEARGILAYLLSKPDDWQVRMADLVARTPDGERRVRTAMNELEQAGYVTRRRIRGGWETVVHERPTAAPPQDVCPDGQGVAEESGQASEAQGNEALPDAQGEAHICRNSICQNSICRNSGHTNNEEELRTKKNSLPGAAKGRRKGEKKAVTHTTALLFHFTQRWAAKYPGARWPANPRQDNAIAYRILLQLGDDIEGARAAVDRYFADGRDFVRGHPLKLLLGQLTRYLVASPSGSTVAGGRGAYVPPPMPRSILQRKESFIEQ